MKVDFKFNNGELIVTPIGSVGIITMCGFIDEVKKYYVTTEHNQDWFNESQIQKAERNG